METKFTMGEQKIFELVNEKIDSLNRNTILIGVDGGQGCGKSTFLEELEKYFTHTTHYNILQIETDDFLIEREKREHLPPSFFDSLTNLNHLFDFEQMTAVLKSLLTSTEDSLVVKNLYNHATGKKDREKTFHLKSNNIIVVGGPYLLYPHFPKFDLKIFIYVSEKNRFDNTMKRALSRQRSLESQKVLFDKFEKFYVPYFKEKMSQYDLFVDNTNFKKKIIKYLPPGR